MVLNHRCASREEGTGESPPERRRSDVRLMERFADARSPPVQPCVTPALLESIRHDVLQLIRLRALPGGLRTCMI